MARGLAGGGVGGAVNKMWSFVCGWEQYSPSPTASTVLYINFSKIFNLKYLVFMSVFVLLVGG